MSTEAENHQAEIETLEDNYKQLLANQIEINESLRSHIDELNKQIDEQCVLPNLKDTMCENCTFRKEHMKNHYRSENAI